MTENEITLSDSVAHITVDGREVYLVGTAHVSKESVDDVRNTVALVKPDSICVELCAGRHKAMMQKESWEKMDIFKVIKEKKGVFLLAQLVMGAFYKRLGDKLGIKPGAEMLEGIKLADETGVQLVLADRDIQITLKRVWGYLGFWNKMKLATHLLASIFSKEEINDAMIEQIKGKDQLENVMAEFSEAFPEIKKRLIDERDVFLAQKIREAKGPTVVAVVGAGHVNGIKQYIQKDNDLEPLMKLPEPSIWPTLLKWIIPIALVVLLVLGFYKGGAQHSMESIWIWILVTGTMAALGSAAALANPLTILASFVGAPLTTIHPLLAVGWIAGLVQAWVKKPTVADFENLSEAVGSFKAFWNNSVTKILVVVMLSNIGASFGTFISIWLIARRTF
ncbi:MAG TPA: TraB/GumN family protein [Sedimentisphaerales bacterium]|nr:TraB/GumN family protein [Sedimentisphaerales bacterium]